MPVTIVVQSSLSLLEPIALPGGNDEDEKGKRSDFQRLELVKATVRAVVAHFGSCLKLDSISVITYAATHEVLVPFTRDPSVVEAGLAKLTWREGNNLEAGLHGAHVVMKEACESAPSSASCRVVFVTDGNVGPLSRPVRRQLVSDCGEDRARSRVKATGGSAAAATELAMRGFSHGGGRTAPLLLSSTSSPRGQDFPLAFPFPYSMHFVSLCDGENRSCLKSRVLFEKILDWNLSAGSVHQISPSGGFQVIKSKMEEICRKVMPIYKAVLKCGKLSEKVTLFPSPNWEMPKKLMIVGFLRLSDVGSPPIVSRHVVHQLPPDKDAVTKRSSRKSSKKSKLGEDGGDGDEFDETKVPSFCVLLLNSVKSTSTAAVVKLGARRFGILYASAIDSKKRKSGLVISIFPPGPKPIPWLPNFNHLAPLPEVKEFGAPKDSPMSPDGTDAGEAEADEDGENEEIDDDDLDDDDFDVAGEDAAEEEEELTELLLASSGGARQKPSYAMNANYFVWTDDNGLESDLMKVIRAARKVPERTAFFFRELNRVRKAAVSYGFDALLPALADALQREATTLPAGSHPEAAVQLNHAVACLRKDCMANIAPLPTKFQAGGR